MSVYCYQISPQSAFGTPLRSDTLYGHLLCASAERQGEAGVSQLIEQFADKQPPFTLSSAFPAGMLPFPTLSGISRKLFKELAKEHISESTEERNRKMFTLLSKYKEFRKQAFLKRSDWQELSGGISQKQLFLKYLSDEAARDDASKSARVIKPEKSRTLHNSLDRFNGRVLPEGGLYSEEAEFYPPGTSFDLYVKTDDLTRFEQLLEHVAQSGFGADSSTGKGQFHYDRDPDFDDSMFKKQGNAQMSLSVCANLELEEFEGTYNLMTKLGKVWKGLGEKNPFKKPFIAFTEGSVFTRMSDSNYVLRNIHTNSKYVQIGLPLTLPLTLEVDA